MPPIPEPQTGESEDEFIKRCMADETMNEDFPDHPQRLAVCFQAWREENAMPRTMIERRAYPISELRVTRQEGKPSQMAGHAAVFNSLSEELWGFKERVLPGAFAKSLNRDIRALWNHDPNHVLGRTRNQTLALAEDDVGLAVTITPPDTQMARDVLTLIERGDVSQMSFGFRTLTDRWHEEDGLPIRELVEVELFDVSPVTFPAYPQTDIALRSLETWRKQTTHGRDGVDLADLDHRRRRLRLLELEGP